MPEPFELYLIRHAIAEERGDKWPDDDKRPLSLEGTARMRKAANGLARMGVTLDAVLTSPLVRARQTAEIVAGAFGSRPPVIVAESLAPDGTYAAVLADVEKQTRRRRLALVGHEPDLGDLAAKLAGLQQPLPFKKGAVCRIDLDGMPPAHPGTIAWFVTPAILRLLGK
jgi:phosphohistidine phosphatase